MIVSGESPAFCHGVDRVATPQQHRGVRVAHPMDPDVRKACLATIQLKCSVGGIVDHWSANFRGEDQVLRVIPLAMLELLLALLDLMLE
jgi:hypothetical protein